MAPGARLGRRIVISRRRQVGGERRIGYAGRDRRGLGRRRWRLRTVPQRPRRRREQQHY